VAGGVLLLGITGFLFHRDESGNGGVYRNLQLKPRETHTGYVSASPSSDDYERVIPDAPKDRINILPSGSLATEYNEPKHDWNEMQDEPPKWYPHELNEIFELDLSNLFNSEGYLNGIMFGMLEYCADFADELEMSKEWKKEFDDDSKISFYPSDFMRTLNITYKAPKSFAKGSFKPGFSLYINPEDGLHIESLVPSGEKEIINLFVSWEKMREFAHKRIKDVVLTRRVERYNPDGDFFDFVFDDSSYKVNPKYLDQASLTGLLERYQEIYNQIGSP